MVQEQTYMKGERSWTSSNGTEGQTLTKVLWHWFFRVSCKWGTLAALGAFAPYEPAFRPNSVAALKH